MTFFLHRRLLFLLKWGNKAKYSDQHQLVESAVVVSCYCILHETVWHRSILFQWDSSLRNWEISVRLAEADAVPVTRSILGLAQNIPPNNIEWGNPKGKKRLLFRFVPADFFFLWNCFVLGGRCLSVRAFCLLFNRGIANQYMTVQNNMRFLCTGQ